VRREGTTVLIVLPAEIDMTNAGHVGAELARALGSGPETLVADMTATMFCDSAGVQMLVRARQQASAAGTAVRLAVHAPQVRRVLELTGADQVIDTYPSMAVATDGLAVDQ
jgi:anti-sigma B factor antagonist